MAPSTMRGRAVIRIAVTGLGVKAPAGCDLRTYWDTLVAGRSCAAPIRGFDPSDLPVQFACEVQGFEPGSYLDSSEIRRSDRVTQLGFAAAADAFSDAGSPGADPARSAVVVGTAVGGLTTLENQHASLLRAGSRRVSPFFVPMMMANATAAVVGMKMGWTGPNLSVTTGCAAGAHAVGEATRLIREGSADIVLAGGTESGVTPISIAGFARMGALSSRHHEPERASRPFDVARDGFVLGEGAAFLVLERWDRAEARDARIYGEMAGYGRNADAYHLTVPSPGGAGPADCMRLALEDAGISPGGVGHVNAHGTSTRLNDLTEAEALTKVFGPSGPPVTSTKGSIGHLIGAAGAAEAVASLLALRSGLVPPVANHEEIEPGLLIDVVAGEPRHVPPAPAISNSFAFGGHNASLIFTPARASS